MNLANLVLIDTCIWASYFARKDSPHKQAVETLFDDDRAALIGPIVSEVLLGCKRDAQADWIVSSLDGMHYVEVEWDDWRFAAQLGRQLASGGHELPLSDLVVATVARRLGCQVYTIDPHFDLIDDLRRYPDK